MGQGVLVTEDTEAGAELVRRLDRFTPVKAAGWVKDVEKSNWHLYMASDAFDGETLRPAYAEVMKLAAELPGPEFDPFLVNLVPTRDPIARDLLGLYQEYPGLTATHLGATYFGGRVVDGVYVYPPPAAPAAPVP